jgi:hypothetical protein
MTSEFEREQELRRLLAEAVEPVEPAPDAQPRLLARARAQHNRRSWHRRPLMTRWAPAVLATLLVIAGVTVVFTSRGGDGSSASTSAGSAAAGAPSPGPVVHQQRPLRSLAPSTEAANASAPSLEDNAGGGTSFDSGTEFTPTSLVPSDLDGDGRPDTFTLGAGTLAADLSRYGLEAVSLPPLGLGARVLGVTSLTDLNGHAISVIFIRLRQVGASSTDTVAALVDGHLTVLQRGSKPELLTIDASHGYTCNQGTLVLSASTTPLVVEGSQLVASRLVRAAAAAPRTSTACF